MSRPLFTVSIALASFSLNFVGGSYGQNTEAQVEAASRAARQQAARDRVENDTAIATPSTGGRTTRDDKTGDTTAQPEQLKRRAGEKSGDEARGRSQILGMYVQEGDNGHVKVIEVGAATPAFAAGIKRGDVIVSFADFKGTTYRKWIDGIRRVATEAKGGDMIPVVVLRNGEQVATEIRAPESHTGPLQLPIGPVPQPGQPVSTGQQADVIGVPGGGNNVAMSNSGVFGEFFNPGGAPAAERAMAELFRVGAASNKLQGNAASDAAAGGSVANANAGGTNPGANAGDANAANARIGLAGFRNDANGMLVMVDVGGLQPGNYLVGIGDPSVAGNAGGGASVPTNSVEAPAGGEAGSSGGGPPAPAAPPNSQQLQPAGGTSQPGNSQRGATGPASPQSSVRPSQALIPRTVLAQVLDGTQNAPNGQRGTAIPPTGQAQPSTIPPTGQVNPTSTLPTGQSAANNALTERMNRANANKVGGGSAAITLPVGTLTVDQSGTGRLQQVVEGVTVQTVVGQALIIVAQPQNTSTTLPPNLDPTIEGKAAKAAGGAEAETAAAPAVTTNQPANPAAAAANPDATGPVAAGVIRLLSDRGPNPPAGADERSAANRNAETPAAQPGVAR